MAAPAPAPARHWPNPISKFTITMVATAFKLNKPRTHAFLNSPAVTAAVAALAAWKSKYSTNLSPSLAHFTTVRPPSERREAYLLLLERMIHDSRDFFNLRPGDPVGLADMRDAHRVLNCAASRAMWTVGATSPHPRRPVTKTAVPRRRRAVAAAGRDSASPPQGLPVSVSRPAVCLPYYYAGGHMDTGGLHLA